MATAVMTCWGTAAFAFATCVVRAFALFGWCAAIRGVDGGGLIEGLPATLLPPDDQGERARTTVEVELNDRREKELADAGIAPLVNLKHRDAAAFSSTPSCHRGAQLR